MAALADNRSQGVVGTEVFICMHYFAISALTSQHHQKAVAQLHHGGGTCGTEWNVDRDLV
jgi:hypothetical protein